MKGWKIVKPFTAEEKEVKENLTNSELLKVKITKALLTTSDVLRFSGELDTVDFSAGSYGVGIISDESETDSYGIKKGKHVYIDPVKNCGKCFNCINGNPDDCSDILTAGEDFDGFLRDFATADVNNIFVLPDSVSDFEALFIEHISLSLTIMDKLDIKKGDYVAIVGSNNFGNILAQILIYHQAVPILIGNDREELQNAKDSGVYYVLGPEDNWQKEVSSITGGRMTKSVVYLADSDIPASKAFSLASFNAGVAFTGVSYKNNPISFNVAIKKQLDIHCVNNGTGNTEAGINLIANRAVDFSHLKINKISYENVPEALKQMNENLKNEKPIFETVVEMFQ